MALNKFPTVKSLSPGKKKTGNYLSPGPTKLYVLVKKLKNLREVPPNLGGPQLC